MMVAPWLTRRSPGLLRIATGLAQRRADIGQVAHLTTAVAWPALLMLPVWLRLRLTVRGRCRLRGVSCLRPGQAVAGNMTLLSTNVTCARVNPLASGWRTATAAGLCFGSRSSQLLLSICAVDAHGQLTDLLHGPLINIQARCNELALDLILQAARISAQETEHSHVLRLV
jgi:hypothetical protein